MDILYCVLGVAAAIAVLFIWVKALGGIGRRGKGRYR